MKKQRTCWVVALWGSWTPKLGWKLWKPEPLQWPCFAGNLREGAAVGFPERGKNSQLLGVYGTFSFFDLSHKLCSCNNTSVTKDLEQRCGDRCWGYADTLDLVCYCQVNLDVRPSELSCHPRSNGNGFWVLLPNFEKCVSAPGGEMLITKSWDPNAPGPPAQHCFRLIDNLK